MTVPLFALMQPFEIVCASSGIKSDILLNPNPLTSFGFKITCTGISFNLLLKGIAFVKSRRAELNVVQMVENMRDQAMPNGVIINDAYCDRSMTRDYDREGLNAFFATLKEEDFEVVVVRSLNEITDDIYDLEEFVKTITDMGIWLYSLEVGPVPIIVSHAEDFGC